MNKPSEDKATPVKGDQNKTKITKDELNEQELDKASGGAFIRYDAKLPGGQAGAKISWSGSSGGDDTPTES